MTSRSPRHALVGWALTVLGVVGTAGLATAAGAGSTAAEHAPTQLLVFAAVSLSDALDEVDRAFTARTGVRVNASYAASSVLAKQIEAGAPADAFFSADLAWVDYLDERGLLKRGSRRDVLGNALVLIAPADSPLRLSITPGFDLAGALGEGRLATADPDSVPAGKYARAALTKLGVWQSVSDRLVRGENVRAALAYVARGEAPLGIVYQTDAQAEKRVRVVGVFPEDSHPPITYPVALTVRARPEAARFADFLASETAREIFMRYGFTAVADRTTRERNQLSERTPRTSEFPLGSDHGKEERLNSVFGLEESSARCNSESKAVQCEGRAVYVTGRSQRAVSQESTQGKACGRKGGNPNVHPQTLSLSRQHRPVGPYAAQGQNFPL